MMAISSGKYEEDEYQRKVLRGGLPFLSRKRALWLPAAAATCYTGR
jgi:hypothetical protein